MDNNYLFEIGEVFSLEAGKNYSLKPKEHEGLFNFRDFWYYKPTYVMKELWKNGEEWETFYFITGEDKYRKFPKEIVRARFNSKDIDKIVGDSIFINGKLISKIVYDGREHTNQINQWLEKVRKIDPDRKGWRWIE